MIKLNKSVKTYLALLTAAVLMLSGCGMEEYTDAVGITAVWGNRREEVPCVSSDRYAHNTLNEEQQIVYDEMLDAIMNM